MRGVNFCMSIRGKSESRGVKQVLNYTKHIVEFKPKICSKLNENKSLKILPGMELSLGTGGVQGAQPPRPSARTESERSSAPREGGSRRQSLLKS